MYLNIIRPSLILEIRKFGRPRWRRHWKIYNIVGRDNDGLYCSHVQLLSSSLVWFSVTILQRWKDPRVAREVSCGVIRQRKRRCFASEVSLSDIESSHFWRRSLWHVCLKSLDRWQVFHAFDTFMMIPLSTAEIFSPERKKASSSSHRLIIRRFFNKFSDDVGFT